MENQSFTKKFLQEVVKIAQRLDYNKIDKMAQYLSHLRKNKGRVFFIGVGGSAANCSHAVNDFRKICEIDTYSPIDNISEMTARTNDEGWETVFSEWLKISNASSNDCLFVLSVGGGNKEKNVSANIIFAIDEGLKRGMKILGIVGKEDGYTYQNGNLIIHVPNVSKERITPHSESFQSVIWHCLVSNPILAIKANKWESYDKK